MKKTIRQTFGALLFTGTLITANTTLAQRIEVTNTTTTSEGTVSEFGPQAIIIKTEAGTQPVRYIFNETTNYVDEAGNPLVATSVRAGLPVTVYYTKVGDTLIASKILVKLANAVPAAPIEPALVTTIGTISQFGPERIVIRTETSPEPLHYSYGKTTTYLDETGVPVAIKTLRPGVPVTVYYTRIGDAMVASKIVVRKDVITLPTVIEQKKTTTTTETQK